MIYPHGREMETELHLHKNISKHLAPFYDVDKNGIYDPSNGDYPLINGDQALWYVYNDVGAAHGENQRTAYRVLSAREMAFAFTSNDVLNDMTFYQTIVINRSTNHRA